VEHDLQYRKHEEPRIATSVGITIGWSDDNGNVLDFISVNRDSDSDEIAGSDRHDENMMDQECWPLLSYLVPRVKHFVLSERFPCRKHHFNRILHSAFTILLDQEQLESARRAAFLVPEYPSVQGRTVPSGSGWDEFECDVTSSFASQ
jgi:hypothetical protein